MYPCCGVEVSPDQMLHFIGLTGTQRHLYPFHTRNLGRPECAFIAHSVRHECTHFISSHDECGVEKAPSNLPLPQV